LQVGIEPRALRHAQAQRREWPRLRRVAARRLSGHGAQLTRSTDAWPATSMSANSMRHSTPENLDSSMCVSHSCCYWTGILVSLPSPQLTHEDSGGQQPETCWFGYRDFPAAERALEIVDDVAAEFGREVERRVRGS